KFAVLVRVRKFWVELSQHIQVGYQGIAGILIHVVAAALEKTIAILYYFYPIESYTAFGQQVHLALWKIAPYNRNLFDIFMEERSRPGYISCRTTNNTVDLAKRRFQSIEGHGAYYDQ